MQFWTSLLLLAASAEAHCTSIIHTFSYAVPYIMSKKEKQTKKQTKRILNPHHNAPKSNKPTLTPKKQITSHA